MPLPCKIGVPAERAAPITAAGNKLTTVGTGSPFLFTSGCALISSLSLERLVAKAVAPTVFPVPNATACITKGSLKPLGLIRKYNTAVASPPIGNEDNAPNK